VDDMVEQQKDAKLYEQICRTILSDKDLKRVCLAQSFKFVLSNLIFII
jgi:hypothetical protein